MNRKLLVTLLHKNIEELSMITEGFLEMNAYPQAIIQLAKRKTEDIQLIIDQLTESTTEIEPKTTTKVEIMDEPTIDLQESLVVNELEVEIKLENIEVEEPILEEIKVEIPLQNEVLEEQTESSIESLEITPEVEISEISGNEIEEIIIKEVIPEEIIEQQAIEQLIPEQEVVEQEIVMQEVVEEEVIEEEVIEQEVIKEETIITQLTEVEEKSDFSETTQTTETVVTEVKIHTEELRKVTIADRIANQSTSRNEKLSHIDNSLSTSIANKKITDIKQAISIGDRFRFQRELFKSNGEDMNKTLTYLNQLATLDEAMSFLKSKYGWENGAEAVVDFYQIVKRKYV